jgi:hypothetical protein
MRRIHLTLNKLFKNKNVNINLTFSLKNPKKIITTNYTKYTSFILATMLSISETLPFINNKCNGILDGVLKTIININNEYEKDFE